MPWQPVPGGTKPPYAWDDEEKKEVPEKVVQSEQESFTKELLGLEKPTFHEPVKKPTVIVFDSKIGSFDRKRDDEDWRK